MRIRYRDLKKMVHESLTELDVDCAICKAGKPHVKKSRMEEEDDPYWRENEADVSEVSPPGREKQVKGIKKHMKKGDISKTYVDDSGKRQKTNPWAMAWAQQKKHGKPKK